jgi:hypothetical protein
MSQLAERVMTARSESICPKCKHPIGVGVLIGKLPGIGWCHVKPCITGGRTPMIGPSNEPAAKGGGVAAARSPAMTRQSATYTHMILEAAGE